MNKTLILGASIALMSGFAAAVPPSITFTADNEYQVRFYLSRDRGTAPDAPWDSLVTQPQKRDGRRFVPTGDKSWEYRFNPFVNEMTFATMDDLGRWQELVARREWRNPFDMTLAIEVREDGEWFRFYVNGMYVNRLPRGGKTANMMNFKADRGFPIALDFKCTKTCPRFETVDITERANANGLPGRKSDPAAAGTVVVADGVPFLLSRNQRADSIDLSMSWNAAAFRTGYTACHAHQRWQDPLKKTPLRYQFAVPGRDYDALYVLCASDDRVKNSIPRFTAQFYRWRSSYAGSGRPFNFTSEAVPVATDGKLTVVKIPLSGDMVTEFGPEEMMNF